MQCRRSTAFLTQVASPSPDVPLEATWFLPAVSGLVTLDAAQLQLEILPATMLVQEVAPEVLPRLTFAEVVTDDSHLGCLSVNPCGAFGISICCNYTNGLSQLKGATCAFNPSSGSCLGPGLNLRCFILEAH